jgi:hypothetical protein
MDHDLLAEGRVTGLMNDCGQMMMMGSSRCVVSGSPLVLNSVAVDRRPMAVAIAPRNRMSVVMAYGGVTMMVAADRTGMAADRGTGMSRDGVVMMMNAGRDRGRAEDQRRCG